MKYVFMICVFIVFACSGLYVAAGDLRIWHGDLGIWHVRAYSADTYAVSRDTGATPYWAHRPDEIVGEHQSSAVDFCIGLSEADAVWLAEELNRRKSRER